MVFSVISKNESLILESFVNVYDIGLSPLQYLSKTFTSKVTLAKVRKGLVKVAFPSSLQYLNGSLFKT